MSPPPVSDPPVSPPSVGLEVDIAHSFGAFRLEVAFSAPRGVAPGGSVKTISGGRSGSMPICASSASLRGEALARTSRVT